jgi:hypothetical protein
MYNIGKSPYPPHQNYSTTSIRRNGNSSDASAISESNPIRDDENNARPQNLQRLVVVGGGTAAAQILHEIDTLNPSGISYEDNVCVVANLDGWSPEQRGHGHINHQNELISHYGDNVPEYNKNYADRSEFSKTNDKIIQRALDRGAFHISNEVSKIEQLDDGNFRLHFVGGGAPIHAQRVVLATGLGKDTTLFDVPGRADRTKLQKRMSNMKMFDQPTLKAQRTTMTSTELSIALDKNPEVFRGKKIIVQGSFAPIDAVEKFKDKFGDDAQVVAWLGREPLNLLDGHQLRHAPKENVTNFISAKKDVEIHPLDSSSKDIGVKVRVQGEQNEWTELSADLYVYGLGSDPELPGSGQAILGDMTDRLTPIYDWDQTVSKNPYETVLGLEVVGNHAQQGLTVVGGAATALAGSVKHNYLDAAADILLEAARTIDQNIADRLDSAIKQKQPHDKFISILSDATKLSEASGQLKFGVLVNEISSYINARRYFSPEIDDPHKSAPERTVAAAMDNLSSTQVASVQTGAQLSSVRAGIAGMTAAIPPYNVNGEINYSTDNSTQMRIAIMQTYEKTECQGSLPEQQVQAFIEDVIYLRTLKSAEFVKIGASDVLRQDVLPLIQSGKPNESIMKGLKKLSISDDSCKQVSQWLASNKNSPPEDLINRLQHDLTIAFNAAPKPVHGVPESVRAGYKSRLDALSNGDLTGGGSIAKCWIRPEKRT